MKTSKRRVRNPFYEAVQRDGICIVTPIKPLPHGPRAASNPYYQRVLDSGGVCIAIGRPRRDEKARPTMVKSVRLSPQVWEHLAKIAARRHVSLNALIREAVLAVLSTS